MRKIQIYQLCLTILFCIFSTASALQHGKYYDDKANIDITKYFVSEKLDGFRGYWDGNKLRSKNGYAYNPPKWFIENLGDKPLDGELWIARDSFEKTSSILSEIGNDEGWKSINYMIFDMPKEQGTFKKRVEYMQVYIPSLQLQHVKMIPQKRVQDEAELNDLLKSIVQFKGEGLMLHHEDAHYGVGRVNHLLKVKVYDEGTGKIIGYNPGKGKYTNKVGSLKVQLDDGMIINIGSGLSDALRAEPPKIGEFIVFIHNGLTNKGKPRFARFKRVKNLVIE